MVTFSYNQTKLNMATNAILNSGLTPVRQPLDRHDTCCGYARMHSYSRTPPPGHDDMGAVSLTQVLC